MIDDYIRRLSADLGHLPKKERDAVLAEVRAHLEEAAKEDGMEAAIESFGTPAEVAAGYDRDTQTVRARSGAVVLTVSKALGRGVVATGRGAGRVLKWGLIGALSLLAIASAIAIAVLVVFDDEIKEAVPRPIDAYDRSCTVTSPCAGPENAATFDIGPDVKEFRVLIDGDCDAGTASVRAQDPSGDVITLSENACNGAIKTFTEQGRWSITVVYSAYVGTVELDVLAFERAS